MIKIEGTVYNQEDHGNSRYVYLSSCVLKDDEKITKCSKYILIIPKAEYASDPLKTGNRITALGKYYRLSKARNYGNYDEERYYHSFGIAGKTKAVKLSVNNKKTFHVSQAMFDIRQKMIAVFKTITGPDEAGIFSAVAAGEGSGISGELKSVFKESGTAHILAISGLHISFIASGLFNLIRRKFNFRTSSVLSMIILVLFCIMTGMHISAVRAAIMFAIRLFAKGTGKTYDMLNAVSLSAAVLLLSEPYYLTNTGFLFSFSAVSFLAVFAKTAATFLKVKKDIPKSIISSVVIFLSSMPVSAATYYQVPLYSVLLNLLVIPLLSFLLFSSLISGITGFLSISLAKFLAGTGVFIVHLITDAGIIFLMFPGSIIVTGNPGPFKLVIYYFILFIIWIVMRITLLRRIKEGDNKQKSHGISGLMIIRRAICFAGILLSFYIIAFNNVRKNFSVTVFDVDQGEAILLTNDNGNTFMIDSGSTGIDNVWKYRLDSALKYKGISEIDYFIISHPDTDHINGLIELLESSNAGRIRVNNILIPFIDENEMIIQIKKIAEKNKINFTYIHSGMYLKYDDLLIRCIHPSAGFKSPDTNSYSVVMDVSFKKFSALFTGDLGQAEEHMLLSEGSIRKYDLLKVAHHGSKYSTSSEFLKKAMPESAVISAGIKNSYGHPHIETIDRLKQYTNKIYSTAECGQIIFEMQNNSIAIKTKFSQQ